MNLKFKTGFLIQNSIWISLTIDFLLVDWKPTVLSFFFFHGLFFQSMPIGPISVTFFFSVHSRYELRKTGTRN